MRGSLIQSPREYAANTRELHSFAFDSTQGTAMPNLFAAGYKFFGLNRGEHEGKQGIWYREWAPGARVWFIPKP